MIGISLEYTGLQVLVLHILTKIKRVVHRLQRTSYLYIRLLHKITTRL